MKKFVLLLSMVLLLVMAGCGSNTSTKDDEKDENTTVEKENDTEEESKEEEEAPNTLLGSIEDFESISIDEYDQENWIQIETEMNIENHAFLDGDRFFINTESDETIAYTKDMKEIWKSEVPFPFRRPNVMTDDYILVNNETDEGEEAFIEALDKETGESVYKIDLKKYNNLSEYYVIDDAIYFAAGLRSEPDDMLFADQFTIHKHNLQDGSLIWEKEIGNLKQNGKDPLYQLAFKDDYFYYVNDDSELIAAEQESGDEIWKQSLPESLRYSIPFFSGDALYILDSDSVFHGYDAETGDPLNEFEFPGRMIGPVAPYPVFTDSTVIYQNLDFDNGDTTLIAVDIEAGEEAWSIDFGQHFIFAAHLINDTLYLLTQVDGEDSSTPTKVLKLNPETGELIEGIELNERMAKASNNQYLYMGNYTNDDYLAFFFEKSAYFIK